MGLPPVILPAPVARDVRAHAEATGARECCGVLTWIAGRPETLSALRFDNLADRLHAADPVAHPRDARTAYALDPLALERRLGAEARAGRTLAAFYHSHPEHDAYFSATDRAAAAPFGPPTWPDAAQIVVSVRSGRADTMAAFRWDDATADFISVELRLSENATVDKTPGDR